MRFRLLDIVFIAIGVAIGIILSLQIRANPVKSGGTPLEQFEVKRSLLTSFALEQENLKKQLAATEEKRKEAQIIIERRSSKETRRTLERLKQITGFQTEEGEGIQIILNDNSAVTRIDFSSINENFVQATDLRDLVNALFLKDARAVSINDKRIIPLTPIQSAFDSVIIRNFQITPPFVIEAIGRPVALQEAISSIKNSKIQIFIDTALNITVPPLESGRSFKFISL